MGDANDLQRCSHGRYELFRAEAHRPTLVIVDSRIGYGAPTKEGTHAAHGEPLGDEEIRGAKRFYGWPEDESFLVPDGCLRDVRLRGSGHGAGRHGRSGRGCSRATVTRTPTWPTRSTGCRRRALPQGWDAGIPTFPADPGAWPGGRPTGRSSTPWRRRCRGWSAAPRTSSPSTKTLLTFDGAGDFSAAEREGRNLHFGVREHAAGCVANGLSLCKVRPYQSGFLIFSDFQRGAIRLSALMEIPVVHLFTHDSIGVGEDGPTHQPVEQMVSLRAMPGLVDLRPADANEVAEAWRVLMPMRHEPVAMFLSRQALPTLDRTRYAPASGLARGGYVLADPEDGATPRVILIASGSEVHLAVGAYEALAAEGIPVRVVSLPSWALFDRQDQAYRDSVLPPDIQARVAIEQGSTLGWARYAPLGAIIGMSTCP